MCHLWTFLKGGRSLSEHAFGPAFKEALVGGEGIEPPTLSV